MGHQTTPFIHSYGYDDDDDDDDGDEVRRLLMILLDILGRILDGVV